MNLKIPKMRVVGFLFQSDPMEIKNFVEGWGSSTG